MGRPLEPHGNLAALVDNMFDQVLGPSERAELLVWIREWESANPDVDAAHRVTGWIDVAYAFQARRSGRESDRTVVATDTRRVVSLGVTPSLV